MMCTCCCVLEFLCDVKRGLLLFLLCSTPFLCASSLIHKISMSAQYVSNMTRFPHPNSRKLSRLYCLEGPKLWDLCNSSFLGVVKILPELKGGKGDLHLRNRKVTAGSSRGRLWFLLFFPIWCLVSERRKHHRDEDKKEKEIRDKDHVRQRRVFRNEPPNGLGIFGVRRR